MRIIIPFGASWKNYSMKEKFTEVRMWSLGPVGREPLILKWRLSKAVSLWPIKRSLSASPFVIVKMNIYWYGLPPHGRSHPMWLQAWMGTWIMLNSKLPMAPFIILLKRTLNSSVSINNSKKRSSGLRASPNWKLSLRFSKNEAVMKFLVQWKEKKWWGGHMMVPLIISKPNPSLAVIHIPWINWKQKVLRVKLNIRWWIPARTIWGMIL